MLSPKLLELLRAWYRSGTSKGKMLPNGWLFPGQNSALPSSGKTTALRRNIATKRCRSLPTSSSGASLSTSYRTGSIVSVTTGCLRTGNAPRTLQRHAHCSASRNPETTPWTPTAQHLTTGCSVRPAGVRCASSKPSSPDTHRPPHRTEEATRRDPRPLRLASPPDHAPPIFQRRRHRLAQPRVEAAQRDRFRPSTLGNAPTPTLAVPFSPATPAIRSRSGEPGRRRRA